jgi:hypothetical protein
MSIGIMTLVCFLVLMFQDTTKENFVVDVVWLIFQHQLFFTHHHAAKVIKVAATYWKNMGIFFYSSSSEGAH